LTNVLLLISGGTTFLVCKDSGVVRIEAIRVTDFGTEIDLWSRTLPGTDIDLAPDGGVLVRAVASGTNQHSLTALDPETGAVKWSREMDRFSGWALSKGDIFVSPTRCLSGCDQSGRHPPTPTYHKDVLRLSGENGSTLWNASCGVVRRHSLDQGPISGHNGEVYVHVSDMDYRILAFDSSGNTSWTLPCTASCTECYLQHATHYNGSTTEDIFVSQQISLENLTDISVCSGTTGRLLWNTSIAGHDLVTNIGPDGTILASDYLNGQAVAIRQGDEAWRARSFSQALMAPDGTAYLQHGKSGRYGVLSIDAVDTNGVHKWSRQWSPDLWV